MRQRKSAHRRRERFAGNDSIKIRVSKIGKTQIEGFATVKTVAGEKCMPVVKFDSVKVGNVPKNALGAMSDSVFGDYDVILQNSMF